MAKYYAAISQAADREARDIFGIDANEDLTALQFSDPGKYQSYLDARTSLVQQMDFEERRIFAQPAAGQPKFHLRHSSGSLVCIGIQFCKSRD